MNGSAETTTQLSESSFDLSVTAPVSYRSRLAGVGVVLAVAVVPLVISSTVRTLGVTAPSAGSILNYRLLTLLLQELTSLALLVYVLHRNAESVASLGFKFRAKDLLQGVALIALAWLVFRVSYPVGAQIYVLAFGHPPPPPSVSALRAAGVTFASLSVAVVNPFFEELIVRGFLITETMTLTGNAVFAVAASTLLQTPYHVYQGVPNTIALSFVFLVFSIYYVRTRRMWPLIIAHLWSDLSVLLIYSAQFQRH